MAQRNMRILIVSHAMELGGAERALIGLLEALAGQDVELFLLGHRGPLMEQIPAHVKLLPELEGYASLAVPMKQVLRRGQFGVAVGRLLGKLAAKYRMARLGIRGESMIPLEYSHKYTRYFLPPIGHGEYDLAISFLTPHYFAAEKVRARKKAAWIHTDYTQVSLNRASEAGMWAAFERIAAVSGAVGEGFIRVFPEFRERLVVMENFLPTEQILAAGAAGCPADFPAEGRLRLLSVGRFCPAKNFEAVPEICRYLVENGLDVKWYLVGFGPGEEQIRRQIRLHAMEDRVILLGRRENPYPYLAHCDLYVQPSRYEGCAIAVREAQLLGKCVVITQYPTWKDQVENGVDGAVVPMDPQGCAAGIGELLRDPELRRRLGENARHRPQPGLSRLEELLSWMEENT